MNQEPLKTPHIPPVFVLDEEMYSNVYRPVFRKDFEPTTLVQFTAILPYQVPLDEGILSLVQSDSVVLVYHFARIEIPAVLPSNEPPVPGRPIHHVGTAYRTQVEMNYITDAKVDWPAQGEEGSGEKAEKHKQAVLTGYFDACLDGLNTYLAAILLRTQDKDVERVSKLQLQSTTTYRLIPLDRWAEEETGLFIIQMHAPPYRKSMVPPKELEQIRSYVGIIKSGLNVYMRSQELALTSRRYFLQGALQEAVVYANLSIETLLHNLYIQLLIEVDNLSVAEAEKLAEDTAFMTMVKTGFQSRIGGQWDPLAAKTKAGEWYASTYLLRNRIVYDGYYPSINETERAVVHAYQFRNYVVDLVRAKKKTLPATNAAFERF